MVQRHDEKRTELVGASMRQYVASPSLFYPRSPLTSPSSSKGATPWPLPSMLSIVPGTANGAPTDSCSTSFSVPWLSSNCCFCSAGSRVVSARYMLSCSTRRNRDRPFPTALPFPPPPVLPLKDRIIPESLIDAAPCPGTFEKSRLTLFLSSVQLWHATAANTFARSSQSITSGIAEDVAAGGEEEVVSGAGECGDPISECKPGCRASCWRCESFLGRNGSAVCESCVECACAYTVPLSLNTISAQSAGTDGVPRSAVSAACTAVGRSILSVAGGGASVVGEVWASVMAKAGPLCRYHVRAKNLAVFLSSACLSLFQATMTGAMVGAARREAQTGKKYSPPHPFSSRQPGDPRFDTSQWDQDGASTSRAERSGGSDGEANGEHKREEEAGQARPVVQPLSRGELESFEKREAKKGIIYISRIPYGMTVAKVRHLLGGFGDVDRIYLQDGREKESGEKRTGRQSKSAHFTEGWVEFTNKKVAKTVAGMLNAEPIGAASGGSGGGGKGGKKSGGLGMRRWKDEIWTMKYLSGFKWGMLSEQLGE